MVKRVLVVLVLASVALSVGGCLTAAVAGAGIAAGYHASEKGYKVRNPITKE